MKYGIVTPVLTLLPRAHATWEESGTFADVVAVVKEADRLGYHHCTCSEHVAIPTAVAETRGARYWDPLPTFGALGVHTSRIRFAAHVLVLGYHHPLAIAKRYGTLDQVTDGRLILGVGVGSLREEFDLLGAPFDDRGARPDVGRGSYRAIAPARGRARRRLGPLRVAHRGARRDARPRPGHRRVGRTRRAHRRAPAERAPPRPARRTRAGARAGRPLHRDRRDRPQRALRPPLSVALSRAARRPRRARHPVLIEPA